MALSGNKLLDLLNSNDVPIQKSNTKTTGSAPSLKARNLSRQAENEFTANVLNAMAEQNVPIYRQDDIAPVTTTKKKKKDEEEDDRKWFQKGAFEDGYQFGDVMKTILGTASDVAENVGAGVLGMGEKALDAIAYVSPLLAKGQYYQNGGAYHDAQTQKMFNDSFEEGKKWSADFIKKDLYDEEKIAKKIVLGTDENSVLGEKSDALVQSGGQLLATAGLQAAGVPWFLTTGATSFGSQTETALNDGAGYEQAGVSAAVSAGAEILSEKLSGGIRFGGNALDDVLLKPLTEKIANKTAKTLVNLGVDAVGEGFEEVFSGVVSNLGTAIYKEDDVSDLLFSEQAMDEYLESFIGGAVLGGIGSGVQAIQDSKRIHLSENEQKVVEHEVEKRTEGKTLTAKEQNNIRNEVVRDMLRGYISTDTIEEVLGGETYQTYKNAVDSEDALRQEYEELGKKQNATLAEQTRYNELHQQMNELKTNSQRNALKEQLGGEVMSLIQNDRLAESYNERSRRGQAYQADISKYDEKQRATIQKAIDSGILNNTNRTHEFVDMIAKITADKGVLFDFTNNEKLKESGFAVDGKAVNGYVTKDGVTLNIDSAKSMNSVVGHEITHVLEGTELYQTLQNVVTEYAKAKGDYQGRYDALTKLYEGVEGADVNAELTADLVGDYIFSDTDFVRNLSVQHRNVFQKIYDEIKYLYKVATAGSKEARELEKAKKAFEDAYRAEKNTADDGGVKHSVSRTQNMSWADQVNGALYNGKNIRRNDTLVVGNPSETSVANDIENKPLAIPLSILTKASSGKDISHSIKKGKLAKLDEGIKNAPITIVNPDRNAVVYITNIKQGGLPIIAAFDMNTNFDGDNVHKATSIHLQVDVQTMLENLPESATVYVQKNELDPVGATNNLRGLAAKIKFIEDNVTQEDQNVKFSLSEPVEQAKNLVAVHNLTPEKLTKSLALGGLPMPSIAILKAQDGHGEFGDISLVFGRDTVDPKAYRTNKIYSGDAWTPTYPSIEYKPSDKVLKTVKNKISKLVPYEVQDALGNLMFDTDNARDMLNRYDGNMAEAYKRDDAMKYAYLKDTGSDIALPAKEADLYAYGGISNDAVRYFSGKLTNGLQTVEHYQNMGARAMMQDEALKEAVADAMNWDVLRTLEPGSTDYTEYENNPVFRAEEVSFSDIDKMLTATRKLFTRGVQQTVDRKAAKDLIRDSVDQAAYENWLNDLFDGVVEKEGIRNNKDLFTSSGNRRSFEALHYEHNLENVIKAMREKGGKGLGGFGNGNIFGASTQEFSSIEEMKRSNNRLQHLSDEEFEEIKKGFSDRFFEIASSLPNNKNSFIATDDAANMLIEAVTKYSTKSGMANYLRKESQGWATYSDAVVDDLMALVNDIRSMPTGYFEAKPQRAVGFDEVEAVLVPDNLSEELSSELARWGFNVVAYEAGNDADRTAKLNELDDLKFSLSNVGEEVDNHGLSPINKYAHGTQFYGEDMKLETAPVAEKAAPNVRKTKPARAQARTDEAQTGRKKPSGRGVLKDNFVDRGTVFETMSLKTGNRELQAKFKSIGRAESSAQYFMEHGSTNAKSLKSIVDEVEKSGKTKKFEDYLRHLHNVDRMKVDKPVFGREVTADISRAEAARLEKANPEFKRWADDVYSYNIELREMMVDAGLISRKTAQLWADMYPHYIPIFRVNGEKMGAKPFKKGKEVNVNSPVKRATGGNSKMEPLFETLAQRTEKVFKAVAKNRFGAELEGMMGTTIESETVEDLDEIIDSVEDDFIQEGANGRSPTFTFYKDGEKVTFEITDEMYNTMKPKSDFMAYTNKALNTANNIRRGLLTEYNPAFMLTNPIKDTQDVLINSQHPARTYASYPKAIAELWGKKGQYYQEYMEHGGEQNTYFDGEEKAFVKDESGIRTWLGGISKANNFIERVPRMAEYIASREMGRSIDVSMLDAARVTTDFSAGGDAVKLMNRNGFTFLNASVQGAVQQVRNVREAKAEGVKGWAKLAAKFMVAGLSSELLNHLLWEDDEEYEELSDYVKQSYYVVAKYDDGKFVRIPKGRTVAVIQNGFEQMKHLITGDDEADFDAFAELVISNLAPSNPMENNLIAPIKQALENRAWYGDELVPSRLQDLPAAEQYDETTDSLSKWLGEKVSNSAAVEWFNEQFGTNLALSPYKVNYLLDQYSGAIGDMFLPMLTPEAERGNDDWWGDLIAPISDKFTTDSALKNQNVTDFYTKRDELEVVSNGRNATKDDMLKKVYVDAVSWEMSDLYAKKRKIQNSDLSDAEKYEAVREIQKKINDLADNALNRYEDVYSDGAYAEVGDRRFNYSEDKDTWYEIKKKNKDGSDNWNYTQEQLFHNKLGVSYSDYWNGKFDPATNQIKTHYGEMNGKRYNYDEEENQWYEIKPKNADGSDSWYYQKEQEVTKALGLSYKEYWDNREEYNFAYDHPQSYALAKSVGGYKSYMPYYDALENWQSDTYISSDKDENGDTIYNSRKKKVQAYLQELDIPEMDKLLLYKSVYNSYDDRNYEIIDYLNNRDDLTFEDRVNALRGLGFDVTDDGNISWK